MDGFTRDIQIHLSFVSCMLSFIRHACTYTSSHYRYKEHSSSNLPCSLPRSLSRCVCIFLSVMYSSRLKYEKFMALILSGLLRRIRLTKKEKKKRRRKKKNRKISFIALITPLYSALSFRVRPYEEEDEEVTHVPIRITSNHSLLSSFRSTLLYPFVFDPTKKKKNRKMSFHPLLSSLRSTLLYPFVFDPTKPRR